MQLTICPRCGLCFLSNHFQYSILVDMHQILSVILLYFPSILSLHFAVLSFHVIFTFCCTFLPYYLYILVIFHKHISKYYATMKMFYIYDTSILHVSAFPLKGLHTFNRSFNSGFFFFTHKPFSFYQIFLWRRSFISLTIEANKACQGFFNRCFIFFLKKVQGIFNWYFHREYTGRSG